MQLNETRARMTAAKEELVEAAKGKEESVTFRHFHVFDTVKLHFLPIILIRFSFQINSKIFYE